jgi:phosphopantothenoylcysteine decarboxylase/phosphopantothenate--cysteine ligase
MKKDIKTVILGVTGSIAAYKACELTSLLKKEGFDVRVILTKEAKEFVTSLTLQTLSQNKVITDMFESPEEWSPVHTSLAKAADLVLIAPATANIIAKIASGICDDMLTCTVFATEAPVVIAPAMNDKMFEHRITQENIAKLKKIGYHFVGPIKGHLSCGCEGMGHIAGISDIVTKVKRLMK